MNIKITLTLKFVSIIALAFDIINKHNSDVLLIKIVVFISILCLMALLIRHKNEDHSLGIWACASLAFFFNPIMDFTNFQGAAQWVFNEYLFMLFLLIWIIKDISKKELNSN